LTEESIDELTADHQPYFGGLKLTVLAPRGLQHGVLPYRTKDGLLGFPLCPLCFETNSEEPCSHTDEERTFTGCFCSPEVDKALQLGYRIIKAHEVHHFEKIEGLFAG
jgi:hypothetical protein